MATQQTEKSPYKSFYGGGWVSAQQLLAEIICSRQARSRGKDLPDKFWSFPEWERVYLIQIRFALGLLKLYNAETILKVLRGPDGKNAYTLNAKWLDGPFKAEQARLDKQKEAQKLFEIGNVKGGRNPLPPPNFVRPPAPQGSGPQGSGMPEVFIGEESELSKLRDL